jgi:phosphoglycolate phosphatase-like HAD superfamily hydrolase
MLKLSAAGVVSDGSQGANSHRFRLPIVIPGVHDLLPIQGVILFDIDGTLLSTPATEESERRRYVEAVRDVIGKEPTVVPPRFAGMVDPQICKIILTELGLNEDEVSNFLPRVLLRLREIYPTLKKELVLNEGVRELLEILATSPNHVIGVLTGNLKAVAEEKLASTGIRTFFSELFCADDYFDRPTLVESAVRICTTKHHLDSRKEVAIVGDTPRDIEAANASRATSIGVASGVYAMDQLRKAGAMHVYPNLEPTKELLGALGLMP